MSNIVKNLGYGLAAYGATALFLGTGATAATVGMLTLGGTTEVGKRAIRDVGRQIRSWCCPAQQREELRAVSRLSASVSASASSQRLSDQDVLRYLASPVDVEKQQQMFQSEGRCQLYRDVFSSEIVVPRKLIWEKNRKQYNSAYLLYIMLSTKPNFTEKNISSSGITVSFAELDALCGNFGITAHEYLALFSSDSGSISGNLDPGALWQESETKVTKDLEKRQFNFFRCLVSSYQGTSLDKAKKSELAIHWFKILQPEIIDSVSENFALRTFGDERESKVSEDDVTYSQWRANLDPSMIGPFNEGELREQFQEYLRSLAQ